MTTTHVGAAALPADWAQALDRRGYDPGALARLVADVYERATAPVVPERSDIFRAFHLTPLEEVRVVLLGQDPYHRPGQAHGLHLYDTSTTTLPTTRTFPSIASDMATSRPGPPTGFCC